MEMRRIQKVKRRDALVAALWHKRPHGSDVEKLPKMLVTGHTLQQVRYLIPGRTHAEPAKKHKMCSKQALKWCGKISETHKAPCGGSKHMRGAASANLALARANELLCLVVVRTTQYDGCPSICVHISAGAMLCWWDRGFLDVARTSASVTMSSR